MTVVIPDSVQKLMSDLLAELSAFRYKGKPVKFMLKPGDNLYLYFTGKSGAMYCYTPHKDVDGYYYVWTYAPRGKGSRSGKPERWVMKQVVRHSHLWVVRLKAMKRQRKDQ